MADFMGSSTGSVQDRLKMYMKSFVIKIVGYSPKKSYHYIYGKSGSTVCLCMLGLGAGITNSKPCIVTI